MAGLPPGMGPGPGAPGAPMPPAGMPPQAPMGGMMPPPPPRPPMGPGPASPLGLVFTDLSPDMTTGWQILDGCVRGLKLALKSPDFAKTPAIVAVVQSEIETLTTLISHYTAKGDRGGAPTGVIPDSSDAGGGETDSRFASADVDTVPEPEME